jgi:hypothetical protein
LICDMNKVVLIPIKITHIVLSRLRGCRELPL